jgi:cysteinyl-tRNA synthetase
MENDLDTPRALQRLREVEKSNEIADAEKRAIFIYADRVLALDLTRVNSQEKLSKEQQDLLAARLTARLEKRWSESDKLRSELEATGLEINDSATGQEWSWR